MGGYLKFLGILILFAGLLVGGVIMYYPQDSLEGDQSLSKLDKKYAKIGKELESIVTQNMGSVLIVKQEELKKTKGIAIIVGGIVIGSLFLGLGEAVSLLKKISRTY